MPDSEAALWLEVRECLGVGAFTAAVMLCRKMLFHLAVADGLPPEDAKGFAPTFKACVEHLESSGLVTKSMLPWVERIKDVGNEANHDINTIAEKDALDVATFTEQLLKLRFEMPAMMDRAKPTE